MKNTIAAFAFLVAVTSSAPAEEMTARGLFYAGEPRVEPVKPQTEQTSANNKAPVKPKKKTAVVASKSKEGPSKEGPSKEGSVKTKEGPVTTPSPAIKAAYSTEAAKPLALRYTLLQLVDQKPVEASPDATFRSGDQVQLKVEGNRDGYLYVVARGSSGNWKALFPSPEIPDSDSKITARRQYQIPSAYAFAFDNQAGEESLFLVFSSDPVEDFGGLMDSLRQKKENSTPQLLLASRGNIDDAAVSKMRNAYSRDLLIQKVDTKPPDSRDDQEPAKAVYVANGSGGRLVADIRLVHR